MNRELIGFLCVLWFIAGRQVGHVGAKYARAKKESRVMVGLFLITAVVVTFLVLRGIA